jgi:hypothetical protein
MLVGCEIYVCRDPDESLTKECFKFEREHSYNNQLNVAHSRVLVCPVCVASWAVIKIEGSSMVWPEAQLCAYCGVADEWMPVPGSLLVEEGWGVIDDSLLEALPEVLLRREFELHLKTYEAAT